MYSTTATQAWLWWMSAMSQARVGFLPTSPRSIHFELVAFSLGLRCPSNKLPAPLPAHWEGIKAVITFLISCCSLAPSFGCNLCGMMMNLAATPVWPPARWDGGCWLVAAIALLLLLLPPTSEKAGGKFNFEFGARGQIGGIIKFALKPFPLLLLFLISNSTERKRNGCFGLKQSYSFVDPTRRW